MIDRSPENIAKTLANIAKLIDHQHKTIETLEKMKKSLRIASVWPEAWGSSTGVKVHDYFESRSMHPIGNKRPATEELREKLHRRLRHRKDPFGRLVGGPKQREISGLELAYIRGHIDTFQIEESPKT